MKPPLALYRLLAPEAVYLGLEAQDKTTAIQTLVERVAGLDEVVDAEHLLTDVLARENALSTGVGGGLALPHARTAAVTESLAAFGVLATPLDWDAIDGDPVEMVLLLAGPADEHGRHLTLLSRIMRLVNRPGFAASLREADSPEAVLDRFQRAEQGRLP